MDVAVALGWPVTPAGASGIVAFLNKPDADVEAILARLGARLHEYAVPQEIRLLSQFPLNQNGKVDRRALLRMLESESASEDAANK